MSYVNDTSTQGSKVVHINSLDSNFQYSTDYTTDFSYDLETQIVCPENQKLLVSCIGATIPYTFYNIREDVNDTIIIRNGEAGTPYTAVIVQGNYTATGFATEVARVVNLAIGALSTTISLAYQKESMKFVNTYTGALTTLYWDMTSTKNCAIELGITPQTNIPISSNGLFPNVADVNGQIHGLYLRTDLVSDGVFDSQSKSLSYILARIPIRVNFGGVIFYDSFEGVNHKLELDKRHIGSIRIRLTDERNRLVNLNGLNFNLSIMFDFVYKMDMRPNLTKFSRRIQETSQIQKPITIKVKSKRGRPRKVGRPKKGKEVIIKD